ncbi:hypothetical protein [Mammaliicoccus sciuri]|uniref:hypothetical protein n=1 Tax=Mammaliicoccus sciuri TaxID=1296 RepID=UPI002DB95B91|nr:hypothetical protein [Mammaliicoccus sciuri]MEB7733454.1 hypothetical protein [Mammaliicoccus sciuri]
MKNIKDHKITSIIIFIILILLVLFRNQIECFLYPYPRLTTLLGMVLTILIAYLSFYNQTKKENEKSEKIYLNIRKNLEYIYNEGKGTNSNHKLTALLWNIKEINEYKQKHSEVKKITNPSEIRNNYPEFYDIIQQYLNSIKVYKINEELNSIIKKVNSYVTSSDSLNLKDKEQKKINDFLYNIKSFQLIILSHPIYPSTLKEDDLFMEYYILFPIISIVSESENLEIILKDIISFYSNNTESHYV